MASPSPPPSGRWKKTRAKTRRLNLWIKHSLSSLSHSETLFEEQQTDQPAEHDVGMEEQDDDDIVVTPLCHNIDEAMTCLHGSGNDVGEFQAFACREEHDWVLDGLASWQEEEERSLELLEALRGPDLNDVLRNHLLAEQKEDFANFESVADSDDEFGDFQAANGASSPRQESPALQQVNDGQDHVVGDLNAKREKEEIQIDDVDSEVDHERDNDNPSLDNDESAHEDSQVVEEAKDVRAPLHLETGSALHPQEKDASSGSIYDSFSLTEDVMSPEGRFTRRQHLAFQEEEDNDEGALEIPEHYFADPAWDETLDVLRAMPWEHVPILHANVDVTVVEDHVTDRLSGLDASQAKVNARLMKRASKRTYLLMKGNHLVHEMDHNLSMAEMYVERSKESILHARGSELDFTGLSGATVLLQDFDRRDQYKRLQGILDKVARLLEREQELKHDIESFGMNASIDHREVIEKTRRLNLDVSKDEDLARLVVLDDLRGRSCLMLCVFRDRIEKALCCYAARLCHSWITRSDTEYERMFCALLSVHTHQLGESNSKNNNGETHYDVAKSWSDRIRETLCYQADRCLARALLDPSDSTDSDFDKDLIRLGFELRQDTMRDDAKLRTLTHNLVTIRFDFEADQNILPMVYHRLCALLAEILHVHNLLVRNHEALMIRNAESDEYGKIDVECLERTTEALRDMKAVIWCQCEKVLAKCLEEYQHFSAKRKLFSQEKDDDGMVWMEDLEGLHDVLRLTHQFLSLAHEFLGNDKHALGEVTSLTDMRQDSVLRTKLSEVFRKHLWSVHVAAMTAMGASLFRESWRIIPLSVKSGLHESRRTSSVPVDGVQALKEHLFRAMQDARCSVSETRQSYWQNEMNTWTNCEASFFQIIEKKGNPFLAKAQPGRVENVSVSISGISHFSSQLAGTRFVPHHPSNGDRLDSSSDGQEFDLYSMICGLIHEEGVLPEFTTEAASSGLVKWSSRLLYIMEKLPIIIDDVSNVFRNLCDLYFMTAFRLCAGNAKNERIILGIDATEPLFSENQENDLNGLRSTMHKRESSGNGFMGFGRRPNPSKAGKQRCHRTPVISQNVEAEIIAPLPSEAAEIAILRDFIVSSQASLENIVKLEKIEKQMKDPIPLSPIDRDYVDEISLLLEKRQGAAWSCLFVAALLDVVQRFAEKNLTISFIKQMLNTKGDRARTEEDDVACPALDSLTSYSKTVVRVVPSLVNLASRMACVRAIMGKRMVKEVVAVGRIWEETRLNEQASDYVDATCDIYALLWRSLSSGKYNLPPGVLKATWRHLVEDGYLSLLEGFSRVPYCSTEGRSLMSMDLASFAEGIDAVSIIDRLDTDEWISPPPPVSPKRGMRYVDIYIRAFYYPEEDVMKWIASNHMQYQLNHSLALLTSGASDRVAYENVNTQKFVQTVQNLYTESACNRRGTSERQS